MCGFIGIFNANKTLQDEELNALNRANALLAVRGPDGDGQWRSQCGHVALAHRRLAIIDLSAAGAQPMHSVDGRYSIAFNGEIYNHAELRGELEMLGQRFATHSDTEVIINAYAVWGAACLPRLRGMFAFAIWDNSEQTLFCARDVFGIKPLYWRRIGEQWCVGSQVRALASFEGPLTRSAAAEVGFFMWGHVPEPHTPFAEIFAIPAGHYLLLDARQLRSGNDMPKPVSWLNISRLIVDSLEASVGQPIPDAAESAARFRASMQDTIAAHRVADVPVGVFLSAGLDSSTLAALSCEQAADESERIRTITLGFAEYANTAGDEVPLAEQLSVRLNTLHTTARITAADFAGHFPRIMANMDQPSIDGINTYFVTLAAHQAGLKVVLSGLGGDELLAGYPSFKQIPRIAEVPCALQRLGAPLRYVLSPWLGRYVSPKTAGMLEYCCSYEHAYLLRRALYMPWELADFLPQETVTKGLEILNTLPELQNTHANIRHAQLKVSALEASWYMRDRLLRDSDWASMAHSLELRVPLLDTQLWQSVVPLLRGDNPVTKREMAMTPQRPLPDNILNRPKTGFTVPMREWLLQNDSETAHQGVGLRPWSHIVYKKWWESMSGRAAS